jgi:5-methylcytosine-specific restriction protein A
MKSEALFINGVYQSVLEEILLVQRLLPEHIMFLQPYSSETITHLRDDRPSVDDPMRLFLSITTDLPTVHYSAEIVGWNDKRELFEEACNVFNRLIWTLQPNEGGLYNASRVKGKPSVNLLHIRRLHEVVPPFSVTRLIKTSDNMPVSPDRSTAGGWAYVFSMDA